MEEISTRATISGSKASCALLIAAAMFAPAAQAQTYPVRPIKMIVPFPAGGGYDLVARTVAQKYTEDWGQPVVIDNRPGANGNIGTELAAKALSPTEVKERLRSQGIDVVAAGPERLAAHNKAEIARWSKLIREAKITID